MDIDPDKGAISLSIPGKPVAKRRPRFFRKGKFVGTYNDQKTEEGRFLLEVQKQLGRHAPFAGPTSIVMCFYLPRPKSHYRTGKHAGQLKNSAPQCHTKRPDLDNLVKFVKDCLNGIAYKDDSRICQLAAYKLYADCITNRRPTPANTPRTKILLWELNVEVI